MRSNILGFLIIMGSFVHCAAQSLPSTRFQTEPTKPNILIFLTDDEGFHHISHYGGKVSTPDIDLLAKEGMTFTQAIAPSAVCTPSRYSIMTGMYAGKNRSTTFTKENPPDQIYNVAWNTFLSANDVTMHQVMSKYGYKTGFVGKWHLSDHHDLSLPKFNGDEALDSNETDVNLRKHQQVLAAGVKEIIKADFVANIIAANNEELPIDKIKIHNPEWVTQGAIEFLDTVTTEQPFFLTVASTNPHGPSATLSLNVDPRYTPEGRVEKINTYHPKRETLPQRLKAQKQRVNHDNVSALFVNDQVAALQKKLKEIGKLDNTVFIFVSDHNSEPGKATTYDAGVRIPMLMKWPGVIKPNSVSDNIVQVTDIFATALDIADIDLNLGLDGQSMLPAALAGEPLRDDAYLEMGWTRAVRTKQFKFITFRYPKSIIEKMQSGKLNEAPNHLNLANQGQPNISMQYYPGYFTPDQLYDLENDPNEQNNLVDDSRYSIILEEMKVRLQKYLDGFEHPYDLNDTHFMLSETFKVLANKTLMKANQRSPKWASHVKFRKGPELIKNDGRKSDAASY